MNCAYSNVCEYIWLMYDRAICYSDWTQWLSVCLHIFFTRFISEGARKRGNGYVCYTLLPCPNPDKMKYLRVKSKMPERVTGWVQTKYDNSTDYQFKMKNLIDMKMIVLHLFK